MAGISLLPSWEHAKPAVSPCVSCSKYAYPLYKVHQAFQESSGPVKERSHVHLHISVSESWFWV